eukprot:2123391-Pleurochrysis_carterae.AAC.2
MSASESHLLNGKGKDYSVSMSIADIKNTSERLKANSIAVEQQKTRVELVHEYGPCQRGADVVSAVAIAPAAQGALSRHSAHDRNPD